MNHNEELKRNELIKSQGDRISLLEEKIYKALK